MVNLPPVPKTDPATGVTDWTQFDTWVKQTMAPWPVASGMIQEFLVLKGGMLTGDAKDLILKDVALLESIYQASISSTALPPEQRGKFLVDAIFMASDAIEQILKDFAPQLAPYIPAFLLGTGAVV